jgi:hypothetical protein
MSTRQRRRRRTRRQQHASNGLARRRLLAAGGLTAGTTLALSGAAQAAPATFTVGSLDDTTGASDCASATNTDCTLRQAIIDSNANDGEDTIVFRSGLSGSIQLIADPEQITDGVAVQGPGADQLTVDGDENYTIFDIHPGAVEPPRVSISGLTMADGYGNSSGGAVDSGGAALTISNSVIRGSNAYDGGGAVFQEGPLTIENSRVTGNIARGRGGGVFADGPLTIEKSTISGNHAGQEGGGVFASSDRDAVIRSSTIEHNYAYFGGGMAGSVFRVSNSTLAENYATYGGGAISSCCQSPQLTITAATITGNEAGVRGGGIYKDEDAANDFVRNTIVSGNSAGEADTDDLWQYDAGLETSFSLIGVPSTFVNETVPGSNLFGIDPQLGPLADNGGPTETMMPSNASPVVNKGSAFGLTSDQRGLTRPVAFPGVANSAAPGADGSDIGAVELQASPTGPSTVPAVPGKAKKKCKKKKRKRSAESAKKKKCKKKKKKK